MFERPKAGERVLLVHIKFKKLHLTADICEFKELALSAGGLVVETLISHRDLPDPKYLLGKGKVEELCQVIQAENIELVLINYELTPTQERNLEKVLCCRVLDRSGLILDIFAQRARTFEGKLQVELAQLQHLSTRLVRGWTHLERQKGGIGLRGPGETQLEVDRRLIRQRIKGISKRLEQVRKQRMQSQRARRRADLPTVSLVGYTNSGKSTLFNLLTASTVYAADQLFATLDPTLRVMQIPHIGKVIAADTVGFMRDLPHDLIEAFRATLEETKEADLLLHVIDVQDPLWQDRKLQVEGVLHEIGALNVPILEVYNKIDLLAEAEPGFNQDAGEQIARVRISALKELGIEALKQAVAMRLSTDIVKGRLCLGPTQAQIRACLYEIAAVDKEIVDDLGNWELFITLDQRRWEALSRQFNDLKGLLK